MTFVKQHALIIEPGGDGKQTGFQKLSDEDQELYDIVNDRLGSDGHVHDGTDGEGPKIGTNGLAEDAMLPSLTDYTGDIKAASVITAEPEYNVRVTVPNDSVLDVSSALNYAFSNSGDNFVIPPGIYNVNSTLLVPEDVSIEILSGAIIKPMSDVNVFSLAAGAKIFGKGMIDASGVSGFSKACIYITARYANCYSSKRVLVSGLKLIGNSLNTGRGIHLFADYIAFGVDWVDAFDLNIDTFEKPISLEAVHVASGGCTWVNGNTFSNILICRSKYGIHLESTGINTTAGDGIIDMNTFVGITAQWTASAGTSTPALYCTGQRNTFIGCKLFDYPATANFTSISRYNYLDAGYSSRDTSGTGFTQSPYIDDGVGNEIKMIGTREYQTKSILAPAVDSPIFAGYQDDYLANAVKRFAVTQDSGPAPSSGALSDMFTFPSSGRQDLYVQWQNTTANPVVLTIDLGATVNYWYAMGLSFIYSLAEHVKIEVYKSGAWVTAFDTSVNSQSDLRIMLPGQQNGITKLKYTLSSTSGTFNINRISGYNTHFIGQTWIPRQGGLLYGALNTEGVSPRTDNTYSCGFSGGRWSVVYSATGTINTSDKNLKTMIESIPQNICDAALKLKIVRFKFKDSIAKKSESLARFHYGVIAQDAMSIFAEFGVDVNSFGAICIDKMTDLDGNEIEKNVDGVMLSEIWQVRYDELQMIIIEAMRRKLVI